MNLEVNGKCPALRNMTNESNASDFESYLFPLEKVILGPFHYTNP